ncbi:MAG: translation initiation factor [Chitinophagaceae bacterium]|nr:MAG: translation initiation factor [Chitinophagaceae bacterium]
MSKKIKPTGNGYVFSTDPDFRLEEDAVPETTKAAADQLLKIRLDTKQRGGKAVTLVEGFSGTEDDLEELGKKLKTFCGTGGSAKDGLVIIQGDQRDKVLGWLLKNNYKRSKKI